MIIDRSHIRKILVIKLRAIGDVLLSTAVLGGLRDAFPGATIDVLTERPGREVLEGNPYIDSVIAFDRKHGSGLGLLIDIRRRGYDLIIDLFGNPRSALISFFGNARYRVGYRFKWRQYCYNIIVEPRGGRVHNVQFNLDALRAIGIPCLAAVPEFPLTEEAGRFAGEFFEAAELSGKLIIAMNPGGGWYTKRWRIPQFAELGDRIAHAYNSLILLIWGPGEERDALAVQSLMRSASVMIPRTNLKQLGALLKRVSVLVTNDSGPMHVAAALGTPVLAIFGPTNPVLQGPYNVEHEIVQHPQLVCLGCNYTKCPIGNPCMEDLSVDEVFTSFRMLMERIRQTAEQTA